jgi:hypothetical protein
MTDTELPRIINKADVRAGQRIRITNNLGGCDTESLTGIAVRSNYGAMHFTRGTRGTMHLDQVLSDTGVIELLEDADVADDTIATVTYPFDANHPEVAAIYRDGVWHELYSPFRSFWHSPDVKILAVLHLVPTPPTKDYA